MLTWGVFAVLLGAYGRWWLLGLILLVPPMTYQWPTADGFFRFWLDRLWFERQWRSQVETVGPVGPTCLVPDALPGTWICLREDYKVQNSQYRAEVGRSGPPMEAVYRLLLASAPENGRKQFLAFSDGSVEKWSPQSKVYVYEHPLSRYGYRVENPAISAAARVFEILMRKLEAGPSSGWDAQQLLDATAEYYEVSAIVDAVRALEWWGFVQLEDSGNGERFLITDPGRVWVEADDARLASRGATKVKERRRSEPTFSFGSNFGVINIGHTIKGNRTNITTSGPSDAELLMALAAILRREDIPWQSPGLADVREEIEDAVAERDPHRSGLRAAIPKLLGVCKELAIGVGKDAILEVLKSYVT
jgi:hypothetical protein